jgi:hypothetical protein
LSHSGPRIVNSTGKPRCAVKPDSDKSCAIARKTPGTEPNCLRTTGMNSCCVGARFCPGRGTRSFGGLSVMNMMAVLTSPPPKPPIAA